MPAVDPTLSSLAATSSPPILATTPPPIHANGHGSIHRPGRKRRNDFGVADGRRAGPRSMFSSGIPAASSQLPTPQNSPDAPQANVLTRQFDTALVITDPRTYTMLDQFRISLLREACRDNDYFFIVTHAIFCAWSSDQNHTLLTQLGLDQSHLFGLGTLQHVLQPNQGLSHQVAAVLSRFPMPPSLYLGGTTHQALVLAGQVNLVKRFCFTLVQKWTTIRDLFSARNCPPCPIEIKYLLQLPSATLQKAVYMYFVNAKTTDARWRTIAMRLFEQALKDPEQSAPSVEELVTANGSQLLKPANDFFGEYSTTLQNYCAGQYEQLLRQPLQLQGETSQVPALTPPRVVQQSPTHVPEQVGHLINQQADVSWPQVRTLPDVAGPIGTSHNHMAQLPPRAQQNRAPSTIAVTTTARSLQNPYTLPSQSLPVNQYANHQPRFSTGSLSQEGLGSQCQAQAGAQMPQRTSTTMSQREEPRHLFWRDVNFSLPVLAVAEPDRYALHQAHLRTPPMDKVDPVARINRTKWYQYVEAIISLSESLDVDSPMADWNFKVPEQYWARRTQSEEVVGDTFTKHRKIVSGSTQFRLKSIGSDNKLTLQAIPTSEYFTRQTQWPPHLSASLNGDFGIDFRRKGHYGVDLATDVTDLLHGDINRMVVCISFDPSDRPMFYLMAIEVISVAHREAIRAMVGQVDAAEVVASIVATLQPTPGAGDDEDLVVAQTSVSIDLVDPFMSCIWSTPTRGKDCRHRECFDLDAYLDSRTDHGGVTKPDQWKCPICKKDARPTMLVVDGFLSNVRKDLEAMGKLDSRAITVSREGTWEIKPESSNQARKRFKNSMQTPDSHTHRAGTADGLSRVAGEPSPTTKPRPEAFLILDDDD